MNSTLCLTFDNLGEAAEVGAGVRNPEGPLGAHPTATETLPRILELLGERRLPATFFLEGLNAELYPDLLRQIEAEGHEVAYHSWTHEQWGALSAGEQAENLARGLDAFAGLGLETRGFRPPGGDLGPGGLDALRGAGLRYCSPATPNRPPTGRKEEPDSQNRPVGLVAFEWRHVDASCVIQDMEGPLREAGDFHEFLAEEIEATSRDGGLLTLVLHPFMVNWHGEARLAELFDRISAAREGGLAVRRCDEAAELLLSEP